MRLEEADVLGGKERIRKCGFIVEDHEQNFGVGLSSLPDITP
jgi:hypothetical protein